MNILSQEVVEIKQVDILKHIEYCGRNAYRSHDKIEEGSDVKFVNMIAKLNHSAVLEFGSVYLNYNYDCMNSKLELWMKILEHNKYTVITNNISTKDYFIYTNLRVVFENIPELYDIILNKKNLPKGMNFFVPMEIDPYYRRTFELVTNIGVSREANRHRVDSIIEESTRYCNYLKSKFGSEISFIDSSNQFIHEESYLELLKLQEHSEEVYNNMINRGEKPQSARLALTLNTKTNLIHCAYNKDWDHFIGLRTSPAAHPQIKFIGNEIKDIMYGKL